MGLQLNSLSCGAHGVGCKETVNCSIIIKVATGGMWYVLQGLELKY